MRFGVRRLLAGSGVVALLRMLLVDVSPTPAHAASAWITRDAPLPANAGVVNSNFGSFAPFVAVACATTTSCAAVGSCDDSDGNNQGLIDTLSGGRWSLTEAPLPADASTTGQDAYLQ